MDSAKPHSEQPSSGQDSPDSLEDSAVTDQWRPQSSESTTEQPETPQDGHSEPRKPFLPTPKRRRVTRACDECRRKKIKCDGKQPCTHCTVYSYDCTYDQPSNRRRNPAPEYVEALETRLKRAQAILSTVLPNLDLDNPGATAHKLDGNPRLGSEAITGAQSAPSGISTSKPDLMNNSGQDAMLESMVEATGQLELDDQGHWDFHGHSSGLIFLRRMRDQFGEIFGLEGGLPPRPKRRPMSHIFDSPRSSTASPMEIHASITADLPSKDVAQQLVSNTLEDACALMRFVHRPSFDVMFDRIYDLPPDGYGDEENRFLPLLYAVLAVGTLFAKTEQSELDRSGYENAIDQGYKYFSACRSMMDVTDCRDLTSLMAIIFMIIFLQSSAKLSTCYSYVGIALRASLRMGLHRSIANKFNPIELEIRRRVFWMIRKMDTYVGALLGLPQTLQDEDIDQDFPLEVDDELITKEGIGSMPEGRISLIAATNAHTRLVQLLERVIKNIYPIKGLGQSVQGKSAQTYAVSQGKIREIEHALQAWMDDLPMQLKTGGDAPPDLARVQQLLRMAYAHTQMVLYRPFLHYVSQDCTAKTIDSTSYACAAAGVSVSRNIVHITSEMKKRNMLIGAYWFTMYTTFFAILSLVFYVLENPDGQSAREILKDAEEGRETLASLSKRSMAADRCTAMLASLFNQLPDRLRRRRSQPPTENAPKKRQAPSPAVAYSGLPDGIDNPMSQSGDSLAATSLYLDPVSSKPSAMTYDGSALKDEAGNMIDGGLGFPDLSQLPLVPGPDQNSFEQQQQEMLLQQHLSGNGLPDLNAMMFPSADPFAYPKQPMTILEDRQWRQHQQQAPPPSDLLSTIDSGGTYGNNTSSSDAMYENLAGSMFEPLPPYLMQAQTQGQTSSPVSGQGPENLGVLPHQAVGPERMSTNLDMGPGNNFGQQARGTNVAPVMNLDDIFGGEEWRSNMFLNQEFR
ncbi:MAG: hypothetical protein M1817_004844 [Caeruleum heppii]|nr:MAG: hypothetical protein M1817_004844 [Caeruleum heppii]